LGRSLRACPIGLLAACLILALAAAPAEAKEEVPTLRVAAAPLESALDWNAGAPRPVGVMIDVWEELAARLGRTGEFVRVANFAQLLGTLPAGTADVAIGPIAITEERERVIDLTHPIFHSGLRIAIRERRHTGFGAALGTLVSWQLLQLLGIVIALAVLSGHLLWWFERRVNADSFPDRYPRGVWEAVWWIASTIVTGGCDDKHVDSVLGRTLAFLWMIGGIVLLAAFTSVLTATMTAERVSGAIQSPRDLAGRAVGCQQAAVSAKAVRQRGGIPQEYPTIHDALEALTLGMVEAVVAENTQLMHIVNRPEMSTIRLVGPIFESFDYGLGLPAGSPLREPLNAAILRMREDGTLARILREWLGTHE
jgi:ABC-type amino acid transport substrate-binding protein